MLSPRASLVSSLLYFGINSICFAGPPLNQIPQDYVGHVAEVPKYALVIGVENYVELPKVANAVNDAFGLQAELLRTPGNFNTVRYLPEVETGDDIRRALEELIQYAQPGLRPTFIFIYFAGHGFQYRGQNFIAPKLARNASLANDSVGVSELLGSVSNAGGSIAIVVIDACRDNQDGTEAEKDYKKRLEHGAPGYAQTAIEPGSIFISSTSPNMLASSKSTNENYKNNSPFSGPLIAHVRRESLSIMRLYSEIKRSMAQENRREKQEPTWSGSLIIDKLYIYPSELQLGQQKAAWEKVIASKFRPNCVKDFLTLYPIGPFSESAHYAQQANGDYLGDATCSVEE